MVHRSIRGAIALAVAGLIVGSACGGGDTAVPDAELGPPDADPDGWVPLVTRPWLASPGSFNQYACRRIALADDVVVAGLRALAPSGTHHTLLTIANDEAAPLGDRDCEAGTLDHRILFDAGLSPTDLTLPEGIGLHLTAGTILELNLHLFNATDEALEGTSGVAIKVASVDETAAADLAFVGTFELAIPGDGAASSTAGGCTASADMSIAALWPHMHQLGTHQKLTRTPVGAGAVETLHDESFTFAEPREYVQPTPVAIHAGDQLETTCTYVNDTGGVVTAGFGASDEMCLTGLLRYPAQAGAMFACVDGVSP